MHEEPWCTAGKWWKKYPGNNVIQQIMPQKNCVFRNKAFDYAPIVKIPLTHAVKKLRCSSMPTHSLAVMQLCTPKHCVLIFFPRLLCTSILSPESQECPRLHCFLRQVSQNCNACLIPRPTIHFIKVHPNFRSFSK